MPSPLKDLATTVRSQTIEICSFGVWGQEFLLGGIDLSIVPELSNLDVWRNSVSTGRAPMVPGNPDASWETFSAIRLPSRKKAGVVF
jgi:hypothetical protein